MSDGVVFRGVDRSEALGFIAAIRKAAFAVGKHMDNEWMAGFASTCLQEEAVEWYENLDADIQQDWTRLSRELRNHWAQVVPGGVAAPAAAGGRRPFDDLPTQVSGVIKVIADGGAGYLCCALYDEGSLKISDTIDDAVRVTFRRSDTVHEIRFESDFPDYPLLGFHFGGLKIDLCTESHQWAWLSPYQVTATGSILVPKSKWSPPSGHRLVPSQWVTEKDGTMRPYVLDDNSHKSREMDVMLNKTLKCPFITHHPPAWLGGPAFTIARFVFHPC